MYFLTNNWVLGILSPGVKRGQGVTLTTHPHLAPRSRMNRSYTSSPHMHLHGVQWDCFTLLTNNWAISTLVLDYINYAWTNQEFNLAGKKKTDNYLQSEEIFCC
jgi:hypothetical protein